MKLSKKSANLMSPTMFETNKKIAKINLTLKVKEVKGMRRDGGGNERRREGVKR